MFTIDLIASLGGLVFPPVMDFVKKKFLNKGEDTAEATLNSLAMTSPENIGAFTAGQAAVLDAKTRWFNRDVGKDVGGWVMKLRAAIRPMTVAIGLAALLAHSSDSWVFANFSLDAGIRVFFETNISSWFGNRLTTGSQ